MSGSLLSGKGISEVLTQWSRLPIITPKEPQRRGLVRSNLFETANEYLSPHPTDMELEETRNEPEKARQRFLALKGGPILPAESTGCAFPRRSEQSHRRLRNHRLTKISTDGWLRDVLHKFNLRYRLHDPRSGHRTMILSLFVMLLLVFSAWKPHTQTVNPIERIAEPSTALRGAPDSASGSTWLSS